MTYDQILSACIDEFRGTPEELGENLHDAMSQLPQRGIYSDEFCAARRSIKELAIRRIRELPHGEALLEAEIKFLNENGIMASLRA